MPLFRVCYPLCNIWRKSFQNLICVMVAFGTLLFRFPVFFRTVFRYCKHKLPLMRRRMEELCAYLFSYLFSLLVYISKDRET